MQILCSELYRKQLKAILEPAIQTDMKGAKNFKLYLDTIIINMPTKVKKYKQSVYFDDENIKDIEHQGYIIPFFVDEAKDIYLILGIMEKAI